MRRILPTCILAALIAVSLGAAAASGASPPDEAAALERGVARLEAVEEAKRLQYTFGYYQDQRALSKLVRLFADDATVDVDGGKYRGPTSIARLFARQFSSVGPGGTAQPARGVYDHYMMQGVLDPSDDGSFVLGRFRDQIVEGADDAEATTAAGLYEMRFEKRGGHWLIAAMAYCEQWRNRYGVSLNSTPLPVYPRPAPTLFPADPNGPDHESSYACHPWPYAGITPPMHYPHPVTGDFIHKP